MSVQFLPLLNPQGLVSQPELPILCFGERAMKTEIHHLVLLLAVEVVVFAVASACRGETPIDISSPQIVHGQESSRHGKACCERTVAMPGQSVRKAWNDCHGRWSYVRSGRDRAPRRGRQQPAGSRDRKAGRHRRRSGDARRRWFSLEGDAVSGEAGPVVSGRQAGRRHVRCI